MQEDENTKRKDEDDYQRFPDEVQTPGDQPAKIRFQKYRGLKSFKSTYWDPKENLPITYSKIFQFENFKEQRAEFKIFHRKMTLKLVNILKLEF